MKALCIMEDPVIMDIDSNILLRLKIWRGMYVVDGLTVDGQAY